MKGKKRKRKKEKRKEQTKEQTRRQENNKSQFTHERSQKIKKKKECIYITTTQNIFISSTHL